MPKIKKKIAKRGPILLVGHWHTGTSVISKVFNSCGMEFGNEETEWTEDCIRQSEHSYLNSVGDYFWNTRNLSAASERGFTFIKNTRHILQAYKEQAKKNDWVHFGVKFTHFLQQPCYEYLAHVFEEEWPFARYVLILSHPLTVLNFTNDPDWPEDKILESFESSLPAYAEIAKKSNSLFLLFPNCFYDGTLVKVIKRLGMNCTKENLSIFKKDKAKSFTGQERLYFDREHKKIINDIKDISLSCSI